MNFVDAAVALLREAGNPLHVEELCRLALERDLLDSPGANPLRSFKGRLTTELKRGDDSRVARVEDDIWALSDVARAERGITPETTAPIIEADIVDEEEADLAEEAADDAEEAEDDDEEDDDFEEDEPEPEPEPARTLSPEEEELSAVYADETGTAAVGALTEYRDELTADEDRPMSPEMTSERRGRRGDREDWKTRRERIRRERREKREARERDRDARSKNGSGSGSGGAVAPQPQAAQVTSGEAPAESAPGPGGPADLTRRACEVLSSIKGGQPVPVKQLAQMMRKRRLIDDDPEGIWRSLKAALLADTQRRLGAGLPPRVVYRGRDLFAYKPSGNAELEAAELALETATLRLRGATERTLAARLADLALPSLEQIAYLYLVQTGWREIEWIKRVDRSGYALAREPGDGQTLLVGVRAGNQEVDRRGVGELRAGIAAKNLTRGHLLSPRELGGDARSELARPGAPIAVLAGLPWASALVHAGIAVSQRMVPVSYLDTELIDRLAE